MDVTLAGGVAAVGHLPPADIRALALEVRRKGGLASVAEGTRRAVHMKLCKSGTAGANLLYSWGGAAKHFTGWDDLEEDEQAKLVKQILARAEVACCKGGLASVAEDTRRAVHMKLCKSGTAGANLLYRLYSLGGAAKHFTGWDDLEEDEQAKLVKQILARAEVACCKGGLSSVAEGTRRAVHMKLCKSGTAGANLLYSLGGAAKHFTGWDDLEEDEQAKLVKQILARAEVARGMTDEKTRPSSAASRTGRATSRYQAMFERLRALQGETTSLPQVVTTWFKSTVSDLDKVTRSGGWEKAPKSQDPVWKAAHKTKHLQETMKFIKEHPLPSQKKRKVVGQKGEEERLITVLWYDLQKKEARKLKGDLDDSD
jgi:hypothetical protein